MQFEVARWQERNFDHLMREGGLYNPERVSSSMWMDLGQCCEECTAVREAGASATGVA